MTPRRQRLLEALQLRGCSARTQERDVRAGRPLAAHAHPSPAPSTAEARRDSCLAMKHIQHSARSASTLALGGITFVSAPTRQRDWTTRPCVRPPQEPTLPVRRRRDDVRPLLPGGRFPRSRTCRTTLDACGRRLHEGPPWPRPDLDRARLGGPVRWGTGAKDRSGPRPPQTRERRRQSWPPPATRWGCCRPRAVGGAGWPPPLRPGRATAGTRPVVPR
jgi:integrase/recombinase XerD